MTVLAGRIWMRSAVTFLSVWLLSKLTHNVWIACLKGIQRWVQCVLCCTLAFGKIQMASITVSCKPWQTCETRGKGGTRSLRQSCSGQEMCLFLIPLRYTVETRGVSSHGEEFPQNFFLNAATLQVKKLPLVSLQKTPQLCFFAEKLHGSALSFSPCGGSLLSLSLLYTIGTRPQPAGTNFEDSFKVAQLFKLSNNFNAYQYIVTWCDMSILKTTKSIVVSSARASWAPRSRKALWNLKVAFISSLVQPSTAHLFGPIATASNQDANKKIEQEGW